MPDAADRADLIGYTLTHALLRNELPRLSAAFAGPTMTAAQELVVEEHLRLVTDHLLRHHQEEDSFHWPLLAARAPGAARLLALLEAEHTEMDSLVVRVRNRDLPHPERAVAVARLTELVLAHLEEEDRSVVPLLARHITADEQLGSMTRSRANIPQSDEARVLAMMLAAANEHEQARMLAPLPASLTSAWSQREAPALHQVHRVMADVSGRHPSRNAPLSARPEEQEIR